MHRIVSLLMHRIVAAGAAVLALGATPGTAAADPATEPAPPVPPDVLAVAPELLLGPVDQLAPVALLAPGTYRMPNGEQPSPYVLTQGAPPGLFPLIDGWKGVHALVHGALGRMPGAELGGALPGTAPPPGTALPPGLEEFLPEDTPAPDVAPAAVPAVPAVPGS